MGEEHSVKFWDIKDWYDNGMWSIQRVRNAVAKGWITQVEYQGITGEEYSKKGL